MAARTGVTAAFREKARSTALQCTIGTLQRWAIAGTNSNHNLHNASKPLLAKIPTTFQMPLKPVLSSLPVPPSTLPHQQRSSFSSTSIPSTKYPSRDEIHALFKNMAEGNYAAFFERVSPDVDWTVMGTHPCAGRYTSLQDFQQGTLARLGKIMKEPGLHLAVRNVIGGGDADSCTVELVANAECKNGFKFDNCYAWCCRFDETGTIVEVRAYLDSWMVRQAIIENETPSHRAAVPDVSSV